MWWNMSGDKKGCKETRFYTYLNRAINFYNPVVVVEG